MNDVFELFTKLFGQNTEIGIDFVGNICEVKKFIEFFENGEKGGTDNPDAYIFLGDELLIIEHFRVDCSKKTRKGSSLLKECARTDREYNRMLTNPDEDFYHGSIDVHTSYADYISTAIQSFDEHYSKINAYIKNVKTKEEREAELKIRICFMIEDTSVLPPTVLIDDKMTAVILTRCKEFLEHFTNRKALEWLLFIPSSYSDLEVKGYFCNQNDINDYIKYAVPYASYEFIPWKPQIVGGKIVIPEGNKKTN